MSTGPEPEIALVLSPDGWVEALHRHCADHGGARVRCIVVEPAVALDEEYGVLVTSDRWPALTRPFVDAVHARGRCVLAVYDDADPVAAEFLVRLGVDATVAAGDGPARIVDAVVAAAPARNVARPECAPVVAEGDGPDAGAPGIVAVGGPFGAGATEVALGLAMACARRGGRVALVDADDVTPSLAVRLGLPMEPNLCTAVDAVAYGLGAVPGALFDLGGDWPAVLVGVPSRAGAASLRPADVLAVSDVLAERYAPVVIDVAAGPLGVGAGPSGIAGAIVGHAAAVVAVGSATPVGVVRLLEWLAGPGAAAREAAVHVVVNRASPDRGRRAELAAELQRGYRVAGLTFAPTDPRVEESVWDGTVVDRGPFARALDSLVDALPESLQRPGPRRVRWRARA